MQGNGALTGLAHETTTRYYFFNGQRVAMRKDNVVYYLLGDHLGTTSVVLDAGGTKVAESRHYPYGGERWSSGAMPTDYRWTGQRSESSLGLYQMGARFYDPSLGRWLSPDVIVPGAAASSGGGAATLGYDDQVRLTPLTVGFHETQFLAVVGEENREVAAKGFWFQRSEGERRKSKYQWGPLNPQALNRYTYCLGNPLRYVDPTGHYQWIVMDRSTWGPLSRKQADDWTNASNTLLDVMLGLLQAELAPLDLPGWVGVALDWAVILGIDDMPFHEGDHGSDTIYYDPEEGKYWRLVYWFDEDGNIISHQQYFSWDGVNWAMVVDETSYPSEESENQ